MFKVSASLVHACLQSLTKFWTALATDFRTTLETIWNDLPQKPVVRAVVFDSTLGTDTRINVYMIVYTWVQVGDHRI